MYQRLRRAEGKEQVGGPSYLSPFPVLSSSRAAPSVSRWGRLNRKGQAGSNPGQPSVLCDRGFYEPHCSVIKANLVLPRREKTSIKGSELATAGLSVFAASNVSCLQIAENNECLRGLSRSQGKASETLPGTDSLCLRDSQGLEG